MRSVRKQNLARLSICLFLIAGVVCKLCILLRINGGPSIPRVAYGYRISAALLNAFGCVCLFIVHMLVVFVFIK